MTIKNKPFTSSYPNLAKNSKRHLAVVSLVLILGLFLPITFGVLTAHAAEGEALETSGGQLNPSASSDINGILVSSIPTGTDNIDTPLTEYVTYNGRIDVAVGGKSFFEETTADNFDVNVPACSNGSKPIIHGAYLEWYFRWRGLESAVDAGNNIPTFDPDLDLEFNGNGVNSFTNTDEYWARFDATQNRAFYRRNALIDVTDQFDTDWTAGANNVSVSGVVLPEPDESDGDVTNSDIYGVGIHVFFECLEFEYAQVTFMTGLDWFYELQDEPYAGDYSDLVCVSFPPVPAGTLVDIDAIMSGQAEENAPLRGGRLFYQSGTGPIPTVNSADPTGPANTIVAGGTQIRDGHTSIWTSSLGTEWDEVVEEDAITLAAGDTWACLQAESIREPGSSIQGISGDILGTGFSIPLPSPTDWGDLPDGIYNTDSTGTPGPSHPIIPTLGIGPIVDDELDGQPNGTATGDDLNGDDEDGIVLPPAVKPGETAVFTATVTNETGQDAYLYGFVDWNGDGSFDGPGEVVSITVPTGSVDFEIPATFNVPADAATDTDLGVRFRLSTDDDLGPDGPASDGEVEDYLYRLMPVSSEYDLALIKRIATPGTFQVGDQVTFNILVMNQGGVDSGEYTVADTLPPELTFVSADPAPTANPAVGSTGVITWTGTNLTPAEIVTFTVTAEIATLPTGPIKNIAEITSDSGEDDDSDPADNSDESDTINDDDVTNDKDDNDEDDSDFEEIVVAEYDLALIKRLVSSGPFDVGNQVTFDILVMNQGGVNSGDFTVEDTLPAELTFVSASPTATTAPAPGTTGTIVWESTDLAPGEIVTFSITAELASIPASPIKNIAEITSDSGEDDDSDPTDNSDVDDTINDDDVTNDKDDNDEDDSDFEFIPINEYDLALVKKVVTAGPYSLGQEITYQIEVMNQGGQNSGDYSVEDNLPAELVFVSASPAATTAPAVGASGSITWDATNLGSGDIAIFTVVARIDSAPAAGGPIKNTAEITADSGNDDDSDPTDNSDIDDTFNDDDVTNDKDDNDEDDSDFEEIVLGEYDLALVKKVVTGGPYVVGQELTYQIEVMNQGEVNSGDYSVEDTLPAEFSFVSASPAATTAPAVGASGTIAWDATNLGAGDIAVFTIVVRIDSAPALPSTPIKNTAEITADSGDDDDSDPTDNSDIDDTVNDDDVTNDKDDNDEDDSDFEEIVLGEYDLALIKEIVSTGPYTIGQEITYQITVMNQGELDSGEYKVADKLPPELTLVSTNPAATSAPPLGQSGQIEWTGTNLAPGEMAIFTIVAQIVSESQSIKNVADIIADSGDDNDSDPTDDSGDSDTINDDDVTNDKDDNDEDDSDFEIIQVPAPVPPSAVELVSFIGMRTGNRQATLLWQTASEIDHFGFKVLRSDNGRITDSQSVGWIPSTIDSGIAPGNSYSLVDDVSAPGTYTYWLVDVDTNGVETIHGPVTITISRGWQIFLPIVAKQ